MTTRRRRFTVEIGDIPGDVTKPAVAVTVREEDGRELTWHDSPEDWTRRSPTERADLVAAVLRSFIAREPLR